MNPRRSCPPTPQERRAPASSGLPFGSPVEDRRAAAVPDGALLVVLIAAALLWAAVIVDDMRAHRAEFRAIAEERP